MKKLNHLLWASATIILLTSCNNSRPANHIAANANTQPQINNDSAELTSLVRKVYEWHETKYLKNGFPFKFNSPSDSIFTGIDWNVYNRDMDVFKKTNFFAKDFFIQHHAIALSIDSSIKQASIKWRNTNDGISIWDSDADDWCNCQDYPDNYWKIITLHNFDYNNGTISFNWSWGNKNGAEANKYTMKAKKEDGVWKISYIEGFTNYGTVAHYKQVMNSDTK